MVLPLPDWGSSSVRRARRGLSAISGSTICSMKPAIKVLFPVRTGPTTPMYKSPWVLSAISLYRGLALPLFCCSMLPPPSLDPFSRTYLCEAAMDYDGKKKSAEALREGKPLQAFSPQGNWGEAPDEASKERFSLNSFIVPYD